MITIIHNTPTTIKSYFKLQCGTPSMVSPNMAPIFLVNKIVNKVLFVKTTKEFIDFRFKIFSLPLETHIESKQIIECLGKRR